MRHGGNVQGKKVHKKSDHRNHSGNGHQELIDHRVSGYLNSEEKMRWDAMLAELRQKEKNPKLKNGDMLRRYLNQGPPHPLAHSDEPPRQTPARG
jgi:hypothetical protein